MRSDRRTQAQTDNAAAKAVSPTHHGSLNKPTPSANTLMMCATTINANNVPVVTR